MFQPNQYGRSGWFPLPADRAVCFYCKQPLAKLHGLNQNRPQDRQPTVQGGFLFGVGPYCLFCLERAWTDPDFMKRWGSSEYSASRWDLDADFRPRFPSVQEQMKRLS